MAQNFAYQLCIGLFSLKASSGTKIAELPDEFANYEWDTSSSIIPVTYDFTNMNIGGLSIETIENATITDLSKAKKYVSGSVTPAVDSFATIQPADAATIVSTLNSLGQSVPDPFLVLLALGKYTGTNTGVRSYDIFRLCAAILTQDGERTGEAHQRITGNLQLQECHIPIVGTTACASKLSWTEATGAIAYSHNV